VDIYIHTYIHIHTCASSSSSLSFSDLVKKKELASEEQSIKHYLHAPMHVARERERDREKRGPWNRYGSDKTFLLLLPLSLVQFSLH
jgi:hypothetical protein